MAQKFDYAHDETDKLIDKMEKAVSKEYAKAVSETSDKLDKYLKDFAEKDKKNRLLVESGELDKKKYLKWRQEAIMRNKRWESMRDVLAKDYRNADKIAKSIISGYMPEVYAVNRNYTTYSIEKNLKVDTSYTLYNREASERILRDQPKILPDPGKQMRKKLAEGRAIKWQAGQIQSVMLQTILQGESIQNMAKRICTTLGETNKKASIRYARTASTGAENAGRMDAYHRAQDLGIKLKKTWVATLDKRTRHWHRELDGQTVDVDEPFVNEVGEIMYPGDPNADDENIWNCRCTMITQIDGFEKDITDTSIRNDYGLDDMSYEEWKESRSGKK